MNFEGIKVEKNSKRFSFKNQPDRTQIILRKFKGIRIIIRRRSVHEYWYFLMKVV